MKNEFLHGTMESDPTLVNGIRQCLLVLVWDKSTCMPPCATVEHMEDDVFVDEQKIALELLVESVRDIHTAHVVWAWRCPHAAHLAGVTYFRDQIENSIRDSDSFQKATHHCGRGVPPPNMKLSQRETVCAYSTRPKEPNDSTNIEVGPI